MSVVGPGAAQDEQVEVKPTLDGASEFEYVTILNPLSDDFAVRVAQDIPVNMPLEIRKKTGLVKEEGDLVRAYGLDLKNPDFQGRKHITNDVIIKAGKTINLKGNEAQVAVRQLINEVLQREGKKRLMADPTLRREVEQRIIIHRGSVQELMDSSLSSQREQLTKAVNESNEVNDEPEFPELAEPTVAANAEGSRDAGTDDPAPQKRSPGRPKKA